MHCRRQPDLQGALDNAVMMSADALVAAAVNIEAKFAPCEPTRLWQQRQGVLVLDFPCDA